MENISKMIFVALLFLKCILNQSKDIKNLVKIAIKEESKIYARQENDVKAIYDQHLLYCKKVVLGLTFLTYMVGSSLVGCSIYESYQYFKTVPPELRNITTKPLPAPMWYPFDTNKYYFFPLLLQSFNTLQTAFYNSSIQALIYSVFIFIQVELKILQHDIRNVDQAFEENQQNENINDFTLKMLKVLASRHQQLIEWVKQFNNSMKYLLLIEYSVSSMILASNLIQVILGVRVLFIIPFLLLNLLQIYILAWNANEIIIQSSTELCRSIYECNWYEHNKQSKAIVHLMMLRCQRPLALSIGPFGDMNLFAAISATKLGYSYLTVIL